MAVSHISVRDVLSLPAMSGAQLLAGGGGLDRPVRSVNIMEVPDVEAFVRPGDLLLTTAYPIHHDPTILNRLVRFFAKRGLAALAIKRGRYLRALPEGLVDICEELSFPLIDLRDDQSFDEVLGEVMAVVLADYGAEPSRADAIRERLTAVALSGGGLAEITVTLAEAIAATVAIVTTEGEEIARAGQTPQQEAICEPFPISMAGSVVGTMLIYCERPLTLGQRRLVQQACFAVGLYVAQTQATAEVNRRLRILALEELVRGDGANRSHSAILYDWPLHKLRQVCLAGPLVSPLEPIEQLRQTSPWGHSALMWQRADQLVVVFCPAEVRDTRDAVRQWSEHLQVTAAVGQRVSHGDELMHAHSTALDAWRIAARTGQRAALYEDLQMELLLQSLERSAVIRFVESQIGALMRYDAANGSDLVTTLGAVLTTSNRVEAAEHLYIHYNTLKYRMEQIRRLLGSDWQTPARRTALVLAVELYKLRDLPDAARSHPAAP